MEFPDPKKSSAPPTTTSYVMDLIREGILKGRYPLGSRLDQKAIAEDAGVSLVPVREALRLLEGEGFVHIYPRRGAYVTDISSDGLEELYMIREELEHMATRLAVPRLTPERLQRLSEIVTEMEEATKYQEFGKLLQHNARFHFTIYEACQKSLLLELISGLWNRSSLYRRVFTYLPQRAEQALREHQAIYEACRNGDSATAADEVRNNIRQTVLALADQYRNSDRRTIEPAH